MGSGLRHHLSPTRRYLLLKHQCREVVCLAFGLSAELQLERHFVAVEGRVAATIR